MRGGSVGTPNGTYPRRIYSREAAAENSQGAQALGKSLYRPFSDLLTTPGSCLPLGSVIQGLLLLR